MQFTVGDRTFSAGRMNARTQFHVLRRLAPLLDGVKTLLDAETLGKLARQGGQVQLADMDFAPLAGKLASLPDEDLDYVLNACLKVTEVRQEDGGFAPVSAANGALLFPFGLAETLAIVWNVLRVNYADFFGSLPAALSAGQKTPPSNG